MIHLGLTLKEFWETDTAFLKKLQDAYIEREKKEDQRFAMLAMVIANANRNPKTKKSAYKIEDFMPKYRSSAKDMEAKVRAFSTLVKNM